MALDDFNQGKVTVQKDELLTVLRKNRDNHRETFLKAQAGYRSAVEAALTQALDGICGGQSIAANLQRVTTLLPPSEHTKDYDRVIRMLEMSTAKEITVSESQFTQYVLDDWSWKANFVGSTSRYTG